MLSAFHVAALLLCFASSAGAQVNSKDVPPPPSGQVAAREALRQCSITQATALAKTSKESAEILAEISVYRCLQASTDQRMFGDRNDARLAAANAIVEARIPR